MKEYLIGTGGWGYFHVPGLSPLLAYSRAFDFVEANSTFYRFPSLEQVQRWRKLVSADFKFSVRAHRSITHKEKLQPTRKALDAFEKMKQICQMLKAEILHLQTPPSLKFDRSTIEDFRGLVSSANIGKLRLALEVREAESSGLPPELSRTMQDLNMVHSVDFSKDETPAYESDVLYTRLFGRGAGNVYQPTDSELAEIDRRVSNSKAGKVVMSFHFVRMYKDAARLKIYKQTGRFPKLTGSTGLSSLEEVLSEDASFPATKEELVQSQGWKLFDLDQSERVHAADFLEKLPERTYNNIKEVVDTLRSTVK